MTDLIQEVNEDEETEHLSLVRHGKEKPHGKNGLEGEK